MKTRIESLIRQALSTLQSEGVLAADITPLIQIERCRDPAHGDWASNVAMTYAKSCAMRPRELAERLLAALPADATISAVEIAGPGFINFRVDESAARQGLLRILAEGERYGHGQVGQGQTLQIEFVSANPTSSLHVGHGRGAAYGMTVANMLAAQGYTVHREYYVNDAGRQMNILATSTYLRYLELCGEIFDFPSNGYRGDYVRDMARQLQEREGDRMRHASAELFTAIPEDERKNAEGEILGGDKEAHIDALIERSQQLLGQDDYRLFFEHALNTILDDIRDDLAEFGVHYDRWYSERSLVDSGALKRALDQLRAAGATYEKAGALWFRSTDYGDDKDRVLVRDNGQSTYFASDVAYHLDKFERGVDRVIDIWGADHHGYIARVKAALKALRIDPQRLEVRLVQFVTLWRGDEQVQMSSRSGQFITLRELRQEVGNDAARFYYIMRKSEQHIDFDLALATSQSKDNPLYYIQYAHARICSVFARLDSEAPVDLQAADLRLLGAAEDVLIRRLLAFPEVLARASAEREPHQLAHELRDLASEFHAWYNTTKVLVEDHALRDARLLLCAGTAQVLRNGLLLLGVQAPTQM